MLEVGEADGILSSRLVFIDKATLKSIVTMSAFKEHMTHMEQLSIWSSPEVNVFCAVSQDMDYGPFFFEANTVTWPTYLEMLRNSLFTLLEVDSNDFSFQRNGAPPRWHLEVRAHLNENVSQGWIGERDD